jgi:hypothetical protein
MATDGFGDSVTRKTLALLQNILERAVEWRRIETNPARGIRKPMERRTRVVRPLPPLERGRVAEHGTHDELLERSGIYWHLARRGLQQ